MGNLLSLLPTLVGVLKNLFLGLFLVNHGKKKEQLKNKKKELQDAKDAAKLKNHLDTLSDDDLDDLL